MEKKCGAKNPATCWRHGNQQGVVAHAAIQKTLAVPPRAVLDNYPVTERPLKTMNAPVLAITIARFADAHPEIDGVKMREAILLASELHQNDLRSNRAKYDVTPYIEHPLRNTLRLIRWGCTDQSVLISSILHDTVEDHPHEISADHHGEATDDEHAARENSFKYIEAKFGKRVSKTVQGMSNPIFADKYMPAAKKNIIYADHVTEAIQDPHVFVNKMADFTDNALGLHHNRASMSETSLRKKATKYLLVIDALESRLKQGIVVGDLPISEKGAQRMLRQLEKGRPGLIELANL